MGLRTWLGIKNKKKNPFWKQIINSRRPRVFSDPTTLQKANSYLERYREIVSDPMNLLIDKVPEAGYVDAERRVILHNGNRVMVEGDLAYYREFSDILIINRGVHEPLEEFCFQELLKKIKTPAPRMLELGAYWAHYSMWLLTRFPKATCYMVEPDEINLKCGQNNFAMNGFSGTFIREFVGKGFFEVDAFATQHHIDRLDILHSDIQGHELDMLEGARSFLTDQRADYVFISTHSQLLHQNVSDFLAECGYTIEVSADFDNETTSFDGFILASSPKAARVFNNLRALGRKDILASRPEQLVDYLKSALNGGNVEGAG